jgi:hypothetical protein
MANVLSFQWHKLTIHPVSENIKIHIPSGGGVKVGFLKQKKKFEKFK